MKSTRRVLNFTNRISIDLNRVHVTASAEGDLGYLRVQKLDLSGYAIDDGCPIVLEVITRRDGKLRLELGQTPDPDLSLSLNVAPAFFSSARLRLKVLDASGSGRIIASVENLDITIPEPLGVRSLLPTLEVDSLVNRIWKLRIDNEGYCLELSKSFPLIGEVVRHSTFLGLVMPDVVRQIALSILDENCPAPESTKEKWEQLFSSVYRDSDDLKNSDPDQWADEVADALSARYSLITALRNSWGEEE